MFHVKRWRACPHTIETPPRYFKKWRPRPQSMTAGFPNSESLHLVILSIYLYTILADRSGRDSDFRRTTRKTSVQTNGERFDELSCRSSGVDENLYAPGEMRHGTLSASMSSKKRYVINAIEVQREVTVRLNRSTKVMAGTRLSKAVRWWPLSKAVAPIPNWGEYVE
jgi:hypothetical protein